MSATVGANSPISPRNNIIIRGDFTRKEAIAGGAMKPGHIVRRDTTDIDQVVVNDVAGANVIPLLVLEQDYYGGGSAADLAIDVAHVASDNVKLAVPHAGAEAWCRVATANEGAVDIGDDLEVEDDGTVQAHTVAADSQPVRAVIGKALTNPVADADTGSTDFWVRVEFYG